MSPGGRRGDDRGMGRTTGGPVEVAGAAFRRERADASRCSDRQLLRRQRWLDRRSDLISRARLRAVRQELVRRHQGACA